MELWIGLVDLKRESFGAAGAFTNVVTLYVFDIEDAEPLAERRKKWRLTEEVDEMVLRAGSDPKAIEYGTVHSYPSDDA